MLTTTLAVFQTACTLSIVIYYLHTKWSKLEEEIQSLRKQLKQKETMRITERNGRVSAEKNLRKVMFEKLRTDGGEFVQPIGRIHSCFKKCLGTPRQGYFAPSSRGFIEFLRNISPDTLIGLEDFSHVWIIFIFHQNTNGNNSRAFSGLMSDSHRHTFKAKISPPKLKSRVGVFSTRTPHRPNPIGISLAKIEKVDRKLKRIVISGLDLVEGTPVLDIKPYVSSYDSLQNATSPEWITSTTSSKREIRWASRKQAVKLADMSEHYHNRFHEYIRAIEQVLQADVRSRYQTKRLHASLNTLEFDNAQLSYRVLEDESIEITDCSPLQ